MTRIYKTYKGFIGGLKYFNRPASWIRHFEYDEYGFATRIWYEVTYE